MGASVQAWHSRRRLCSRLVRQGTLACLSLCSHARAFVADLVVCLSALWRDPLVCASLSFRDVVGAWDPASNQLKTSPWKLLAPRALARGAGPAMAFRRTEGMSVIRALAMTVAEIPVFLYTTFGQVKVIASGLWSRPLPLWSSKP